ncbi:ABC transporter permease [Desulfoscipio gibsoniae]|uniref:ABC-type transport system, involved in lipoprotein release, permease component n=1 Tax=Desulfoscipio gibsoniae DSM 7213 TaxID=767817 RepID=R4KLF4_9FIRM|nr:ABC transporter permease [Desulfoscipio gibsoniae]AGL02407.1 ABC-type transport system, involved in lipoprotein release, permease component [Desulfoscipio gibsoniae DSM 7213]
MSALNKKLWRTIGKTKGQFLAVVAVVTVGIAVYIAMTTAYYNLNASKEKFYRDNNFADYYFHVIKAPQQVTRQIETIPGVAGVTGRIQKDVTLVNDYNKRATARLTSYTLPVEYEINSLQLLTGRFFAADAVVTQPGEHIRTGDIEILVDPQYAEGNLLEYGDTVNIVAEGKTVPLTVVGTATGPEFIYLMKDAGTLLPDPRTFGVIMMSRERAQQILNLPGQINQVLISLVPGADADRVAGQVEDILEPYGNLGSYPRKQQLSNAMLEAELDGLKASSRYMPAIFLGIAAAIQFVILSRMVRYQRLQIGVMKALGYSNRQVILHYTGYSILVALCGAILGTLLGLALASVMSQAYAMYFNLPSTIGAVNTQAMVYGFVLSIAISTLAGLTACRSVVTINPAESMRPEPPKGGGRTPVESCSWLWHRLDTAWKMSIRSAARNLGRFGITMVGVVFAVGMLVVSLFTIDAVDYMIKSHFYQNQRYDYLVRFTAPVKESELLSIERIEGVQRSEPLLEIPVKIKFNGKSEDDSITGINPGTTLKRLSDHQERSIEVPLEGMLISQRTADRLGAKVGDMVEVETMLGIGPARQTPVKIMGINRQLVGGGCFVSLKQANSLLHERQLVSGVMLKMDPALTAGLEAELEEMTGVSSILSRQKELDNFNKNMEAMIYSITVMVFFALLLGFAIVYNSSVISFSERQKELASLRVLGYSIKEVSGILLKENLLQSLLGVALGLPFGYLMVKGYISTVSTDLFTYPVLIYPATYLYAVLGGFFFIIVAHLLAVRGVKQLQLVEVLKNKD